MPLPREDARRAWAVIRLAALPVVFVGERLVSHPVARSSPFDWLLAATAVWALIALAGAYGRLPRVAAGLAAAFDLAAVAALTYTSGGPYSQVRSAFFLLPVGAAVLLRPALTAAASAASVVVYLGVSLLYPTRDAGDFEIVQVLYLGLLGGAAVLLSLLLTRRSQQVEALSAARGRLVAQALDAEERERRRLAEALHDEAIQNILAARQELAAAPADGGDLALVQRGLDATVVQLRDALFDLHPYLLDHAGLEAALRAVAERAARRGGFQWTVAVTGEVPPERERLVFSLVRELLANAARHARADQVDVRVEASGGALRVSAADDGVGIADGRLDHAVRDGHIGLASSFERVEALDGRLDIVSEAGAGTRVSATIPLRAAVPA